MTRKAHRAAARPAAATQPARTCPSGHTVFQQAHHVESRFMVQIPQAHCLADICKPSYWAHHAARVPPRSLLTCIDQRSRWEADLRVLEAGRNYLRVAVVRHVKYEVQALGQPDIERLKALHSIEENGQNGWRIIAPDGTVLHAGLAAKSDAERALNSHLASMNRRPG